VGSLLLCSVYIFRTTGQVSCRRYATRQKEITVSCLRAQLKQELVFDKEKILIPYKRCGYGYLFILMKSHLPKNIDEDATIGGSLHNGIKTN